MKVTQILAVKGTYVITIRPDQQIREAIALLAKHRIGALVVMDNVSTRPVGIISERDIINRAAEDEYLFSQRVEDLMTKEVITGIPQDDLVSVASTMTDRRIRHLPILEHDKLIGIISIGDILKAERDAYRGEIDTLETQILADDQ
jgi:CBS domain-containing protein